MAAPPPPPKKDAIEKKEKKEIVPVNPYAATMKDSLAVTAGKIYIKSYLTYNYENFIILIVHGRNIVCLA